MVSNPLSHRSRADETRNPLLRLPAAQRLLALPLETRKELAVLLHELALDARGRAEQSWRRVIRPDVDRHRDGARQ